MWWNSFLHSRLNCFQLQHYLWIGRFMRLAYFWNLSKPIKIWCKLKRGKVGVELVVWDTSSSAHHWANTAQVWSVESLLFLERQRVTSYLSEQASSNTCFLLSQSSEKRCSTQIPFKSFVRGLYSFRNPCWSFS